jgi:hypothetical protein
MDVVNNVLKLFPLIIKPASVKYPRESENKNCLLKGVNFVAVMDVILKIREEIL